MPLCFFASGCEVPERASFPSAKKIIVAKESHGFIGMMHTQPFSNFDSPIAQDYLEQEAAFFDQQIEPLASLMTFCRRVKFKSTRTLSSRGFREGDFDWYSSVTSNQYRTFTLDSILKRAKGRGA